MNNTLFTKYLLQWHTTENTRTMPWKGETNAYKIWLSEIILQQTRVEQGLHYYNNFIKKYPTIIDLANAKDEDVFKLWEGLGYYSRCKNLLHTAKLIAKEYNGIFPEKYNDILQLKGVGTYTAAAIASFAYNQPYAVLDGNVFRVLSRVFAVDLPIDTKQGKEHFTILSQQLLHPQKAALYNQAIMDFGSTICKPQQPLCNQCCLQTICKANKANTIFQYPIKQKKVAIKTRFFYYLILEHNNKIAIAKRIDKDIWQNLHQFYLVETQSEQSVEADTIKKWVSELCNYNKKYSIQSISTTQQQKLTHRIIKGNFIHIHFAQKTIIENYFWVNKNEIESYSFPKYITQYLKNFILQP